MGLGVIHAIPDERFHNWEIKAEITVEEAVTYDIKGQTLHPVSVVRNEGYGTGQILE